MINHGKAIRDGLMKSLLEAAGSIPGLGILVAGLQGYKDAVSQQRIDTLLEEIVPHIPTMKRYSEWYSSPEGQDTLKKVANATITSDSQSGINTLAQRVVLGPNSATYRTVHEIIDAVALYYDQRERFGSVDRNIYGDLPFDSLIGRFKGNTISFMFFMCRDRNNNGCGRNSADLQDTDTVIARVYEDDIGYWGAVIDIE